MMNLFNFLISIANLNYQRLPPQYIIDPEFSDFLVEADLPTTYLAGSMLITGQW